MSTETKQPGKWSVAKLRALGELASIRVLQLWVRAKLWWLMRQHAPKPKEPLDERIKSKRNHWLPSFIGFGSDLDEFMDAFHGAIVAIFVTGLTGFVAIFYYSQPGLVEWIADIFAQNCRVNGVCSLSENMAAFTVANIILAELFVYTMMAVWGYWRPDDTATEADIVHLDTNQSDRLDEMDAGQMTVLDELQQLREQVANLRHDLLALDPQGAPLNVHDR